MGTRCITTVRSRWDNDKEFKTHAHIYRHWDGYLEGHGQWLFEFLDGLEVINGIPGNPPLRFANGPGRLASMLVSQLQVDGHEPDLCAPGPCGQEFHYQVDIEFGISGGRVCVTVFNGPMTAFGGGGDKCTSQIFQGSVDQFGLFLESQACEAN